MKTREKTAGEVWAQRDRLWRGLEAQRRRLGARAHPETDGNSLLIHNWGNDAARAVEARFWERWRRADGAADRLYKEAEHRAHERAGEAGRYLWCYGCSRHRTNGDCG